MGNIGVTEDQVFGLVAGDTGYSNLSGPYVRRPRTTPYNLVKRALRGGENLVQLRRCLLGVSRPLKKTVYIGVTLLLLGGNIGGNTAHASYPPQERIGIPSGETFTIIAPKPVKRKCRAVFSWGKPPRLVKGCKVRRAR